jgi:hypothetical protein
MLPNAGASPDVAYTFRCMRVSRLLLTIMLPLMLGAIALGSATHPSSAQSVPRLALYEPPDGFAYIGMFVRLWDSSDPRVGDSRSLAARLQDSITAELGSKQPAILAVPTTWQREDGAPIPFENTLEEIRRFQDFNRGQIVPFVKWNAQSGWNVTSPTYRGITTRDVAEGKLDDYIRDYARAVRDYGGPIFLSPICVEFNAMQWRSCSPIANPTISANDFIAAWRHTVDIFRAEGVTNVAWVWNPIVALGTVDFFPFYPGDDYVDWTGVNMYDDQPPASIEPGYQFAVSRKKPFFLGEWGVRVPASRLTPTEQRQWLDAMFDMFASHPKIKAVVYYNYNQGSDAEDPAHMGGHTSLYGGLVNYHPNVNNGDSRLLAESGAGFRSTFARRIANGRYLSQVAGVPTPTPTPTATPISPPPPDPDPGL